MILAALVTIIGITEPAPECRIVDRRIVVTSEESRHAALQQLAYWTKEAGGDTARVTVDRMVSYDYPARKRWVVKAKAYRCEEGIGD